MFSTFPLLYNKKKELIQRERKDEFVNPPIHGQSISSVYACTFMYSEPTRSLISIGDYLRRRQRMKQEVRN